MKVIKTRSLICSLSFTGIDIGKKNMHARLIGAVCILLYGFSVPAHAIPTLLFDGSVAFDTGVDILSVEATLTGTEDIDPVPNLTNSIMTFDALLLSVNDNGIFTTGTFGGMPGYDLSIIDGDNNTLLTGEFVSLQMEGVNDSVFQGNNSGVVTGVVSATGGSLAALFGEGNLLAVEFNLDTVFSGEMFNTNFTGGIDGRITGANVAAPTALWLLGSGIFLIGVSQTRRNTTS
jgi:hypothetical protein